MLEQVEAAGLVETYTDEDGQPAMRPTARGCHVGPAPLMTGEVGRTP